MQTARFWMDGSLEPAGSTAVFKKSLFRLTMLYVGAGEAYFLQVGKTAALVDGGAKNTAENAELATKLEDWIREKDVRLKMLLASHPHVDHLNALPPLLRSLPKSRFAAGAAFVHSGLGTGKKFIQGLLGQVIAHPSLKVVVPTTPQTATLGPRTSLVLFMNGSTSHDEAYKSVMAIVQHGQARLLLTGDVYADYEKHLVQTHAALLPAHVLKVTHHGSDGGSCTTFLNQVRPLIALASSNRNPDGTVDSDHGVDPATATRMSDAGVEVFQTAVAGTIVLSTDGFVQPKGILVEVKTEN